MSLYVCLLLLTAFSCLSLTFSFNLSHPMHLSSFIYVYFSLFICISLSISMPTSIYFPLILHPLAYVLYFYLYNTTAVVYV